jgi:hypothetical protein
MKKQFVITQRQMAKLAKEQELIAAIDKALGCTCKMENPSVFRETRLNYKAMVRHLVNVQNAEVHRLRAGRYHLRMNVIHFVKP